MGFWNSYKNIGLTEDPPNKKGPEHAELLKPSVLLEYKYFLMYIPKPDQKIHNY